MIYNCMSDKRYKEILKYIKDHTKSIPAGSKFYKFNREGEVISEEIINSKTTCPSYGLAYLTLIRATPFGDFELMNDGSVLEQACMRKRDQLRERGFTEDQIHSGDFQDDRNE